MLFWPAGSSHASLISHSLQAANLILEAARIKDEKAPEREGTATT